MKIVNHLPRFLFGVLILVGGVFHFTMNVTAMKSDFLTALNNDNHLWQIIGALNILGGSLLLLNRYKALASLILLPITFNIFLFHLSKVDLNALVGVVMFALNLLLLWQNRVSYKSIFQVK
jgi:putative oxidoreductase